MKVRLCVVFTFLLSTAASAQPVRFPLDASLLSNVDAAVVQAEQAVRQVDVSALPIEYREGKVLDGNRSLCLKLVDRLRQQITGVRKYPLLSAEVGLVLSLKDVDAALDGFSSTLASPVTYSNEKSVAHALQWSQAILDSRERVGPVLRELQSVVIGNVAGAELALANCRRQ